MAYVFVIKHSGWEGAVVATGKQKFTNISPSLVFHLCAGKNIDLERSYLEKIKKELGNNYEVFNHGGHLTAHIKEVGYHRENWYSPLSKVCVTFTLSAQGARTQVTLTQPVNEVIKYLPSQKISVHEHISRVWTQNTIKLKQGDTQELFNMVSSSK